MDFRTTLVCAAGICLGVASFYGLAGGSGRLVAAPRPDTPPPRTASEEAEAILSRPLGRSAESLGLDAATFAAREAEAVAEREAGRQREVTAPTGVTQVFQALAGTIDETLGDPVIRLSADAATDPSATKGVREARVVLIDVDSADTATVAAAVTAIRDRAPLARLGLVGFNPEDAFGDDARERAAETLASVDLLALVPPRTDSANEAEGFLERSGRQGRRVLALVEVPRRSADLPVWRAAFQGAVAAGVSVVLTGQPGGDPATEAAWRADVAAHQALGRRLGGIAYD